MRSVTLELADVAGIVVGLLLLDWFGFNGTRIGVSSNSAAEEPRNRSTRATAALKSASGTEHRRLAARPGIDAGTPGF